MKQEEFIPIVLQMARLVFTLVPCFQQSTVQNPHTARRLRVLETGWPYRFFYPFFSAKTGTKELWLLLVDIFNQHIELKAAKAITIRQLCQQVHIIAGTPRQFNLAVALLER